MRQFDFNERFRDRTEKLSLQVINWYGKMDSQSEEMQILGKQLIRSVTATAAGFRAVCRANSRTERLQKLTSVVETSDQTLFWLQLCKQLPDNDLYTLNVIYEEALEILKVMATHRKNLSVS
jgi:four helix bundle protein